MENQEQKAVVTAQTGAVAEVKKSYVAMVLENTMREFMAVNDGMDFDFVRMGEWVKLNKKGEFILRSDETIKFGDTLDVVIAQGEQRWMLWGKKGTPEDGQLLVAAKTQEEALQQFQELTMANPAVLDNYDQSQIGLRYLAYIVPVESIKPDEVPEIFLFSFSPSDTWAVATYAKTLFTRGVPAASVPKKTGVNQVITRMTSEERKGKEEDYLGVKLEAVGMFKPEEFGVTQ